MNAGTLALLIPIVAIVGSFIISAMKIQKQQGRMSKKQEAELTALRDEIAELKNRIQVLEELATDDGESLKREINNLKRA
ncbi:hypothetical protein L2750_21105 [Shewanella submarina]|nr:hypothetical protein [Shewanella submarina]MCL1039609.1 hypothetical protein [Shewanella submarina]